MVLGRREEQEILKKTLSSDKKEAILIYGKRRVGKSFLVKNVVADCCDTYIIYECLETSLQTNLKNLEKQIKDQFSNRFLSFGSFEDVFDYLGSIGKKVTLVIDEYPYLKIAESKGYVDSMFQRIIDNLSDNIKLIILGSYVGMMRELLEEDNPLFGRFSVKIDLKPMDYFDSSLFYPAVNDKVKADFYAVFGGTPYVSSFIDENKSLEENINDLILSEFSPVRMFLDNVLLSETRKAANANLILSYLKNGKSRYSDIENALGISTPGALDKQLKALIEMEIVEKVAPINKKGDKRKTFYGISDNLVRFYYSYVFDFKGELSRIGANQFYTRYIEPTINQFIQKRFEDTCRQYFMRKIKAGALPNVYDVGTLWYDLPKEKRNGEFDCVLDCGDGYEIYEIKHKTSPLSKQTIDAEFSQVSQLAKDTGLNVLKTGFISWSGYEENADDENLIGIEELYSNLEKQ